MNDSTIVYMLLDGAFQTADDDITVWVVGVCFTCKQALRSVP